MTLQEISDLLDTKLDEKLNPMITRLEAIEVKVDKILAFIPIGNEDIAKKLPKLKKVGNH